MTIAKRLGVRAPSWQDEEKARFGARQLGRPEPGFFALRLVKGGVFVGAEIRHEPTRDPDTGEALERSWLWRGIINGEPDPDASPAPTSERVMRIWEWGRRIDEREFRFLLSDRAWAAQHAPHLPEADPTRAVDLLTEAPPF